MRKLRISAAFLTVSLATMMAVTLYEVPEPEWDRTVLDNNTEARFLQMGSNTEGVHIVYQKSSEAGVEHLVSDTSGSVIDFFRNVELEREWERNTVDSEPDTGTYMSMTDENNRISLSYQDSTVGSEEVVYANYSEGNWTTETVDTSDQSGFNVGMYSTITVFDGGPVVAYHSPRDGLEVAFRDGGEWTENNVGGTSGWYTSAASCSERMFIAYTGRNSDSMNISTFEDGVWNTEITGEQANHDTNMVQSKCNPALAYLNPSSGQLEFMADEITEIDDTSFARTGLVKEDNYHLSYRDYGEGVVYANSSDGTDWNSYRVSDNYQAGQFNDLTLDRHGNIHLGYSNSTTLVHAEFNKGNIQRVGEAVDLARNVVYGLTGISTLLFLFMARKERFFTGMKEHMVMDIRSLNQEDDEDEQDESENENEVQKSDEEEESS